MLTLSASQAENSDYGSMFFSLWLLILAASAGNYYYASCLFS